jgi:hypothetical protein
MIKLNWLIIQSKVSYTRTYSLNGRGHQGIIIIIIFLRIHGMISFRFISQFTDFVSFRRNSFCFAVFRFCFVSHFTGTRKFDITLALYF